MRRDVNGSWEAHTTLATTEEPLEVRRIVGLLARDPSLGQLKELAPGHHPRR